ncbi:MAG: hypothetical protein M1831_000580, partial [Alyxoria varia]
RGVSCPLFSSRAHEMEALVAIGLAGNIATFLDCSLRVFSTSRQVRNTVDKQDLQYLATELDSLCSQFRQDQRSLPHEHDLALKGISNRCQKIAQQLIDAINQITYPAGRGWPSYRAALKSIWKDREIRDMENRLKELTNLLQLQLLAGLKDGQSNIHSSLENISNQYRTHQVEGPNELDSLRQTLIADLKKTRYPTPTDRIKELGRVSEHITCLQNEGIRIDQHCACLASLKYEGMIHRRQNVRDAHGNTFQWIFSQKHQGERVGFKNWLEKENGAYWITGRAGSGKSTLMKTILADDKTGKMLSEWAEEKKLVVANHFFWRMGTDLQKTQEGLLRSLLDEVLRNCPELMRSVAPELFELYPFHIDTYQWSFSELKQAFDNVIQGTLSVKFCFFIDGVDEYMGEPREIAKVLNDIGLSPNVKHCLASRPWNAFEEEFRNNNAGMMELHVHTNEDIRSYVRDKLEKDKLYQRLRATDHRYEDAVQSIVQKAKGVFLWVFLVVNSLHNSLPDAYTVEDFQRRVDAFPEELEQYFTEMLKGVHETHHEQSSEILLMALEANGRLPLACLLPVMERDLDSMRKAIEPMTASQWHDKAQDMIKRLRARCLDLLEVSNPNGEADLGYSLDFLHRTVYDYLSEPDVHNILRGRVDASFNPPLVLAKSLVGLMKVFPEHQSHFVPPHWIIGHVERAVGRNSEVGFEILDEAERVYRIIWPRKQTTAAKKSVLGMTVASKERRCDLILESAIQMGFDRYVASRLHNCEDNDWNIDGRPPLLSALVFPPTSDNSMDKQPKIPEPDMVQTLLDLGASASQKVGDHSVWHIFLRKSWELRAEYEVQLAENHSQWLGVVAILLRSGVDPNCRLHEMKRFRTPMMHGVIERSNVAQNPGSGPSAPKCGWDLFHAMCSHDETAYLMEQTRLRGNPSLLSLFTTLSLG